jgi:hypothetical protein
MLAPKKPASARAMKTVVRSRATANSAYESAPPASVTSSTGRRPTRSESRPHIGANRNCMNEKVERTRPASRPVAPRSCAYIGRNGITIPKPSRSTKTVRKTTSRGVLRTGLSGGGRILSGVGRAR